ncbi:hypothetical protein FDECE_3299 [Fusarium decemcellulare]|nr:hypothetical protein FDECE_3299 [Fusarium decemcellulare]
MLSCSLPQHACTNSTIPNLEPYADISGIGVIIGFVGTAYTMVLLLIGHYCLAFDPEETCSSQHQATTARTAEEMVHNPGGIEEGTSTSHESSTINSWRPNPIDLLVLNAMRGLGRRLFPHVVPRRNLKKVFESVRWVSMV